MRQLLKKNIFKMNKIVVFQIFLILNSYKFSLTKLKFNEENKKLIRRNAFYLKEYLQLKSFVIFNCLLIYNNFFCMILRMQKMC